MNRFKTNPISRKRKQQLSSQARKFVNNRINSYLNVDIERNASPDITAECEKIRILSQDCPMPATEEDNCLKSEGVSLPDVKCKPVINAEILNIDNFQTEFNLREELSKWTQNSGTPAMHVDSLLAILRTFIDKQKTENLSDPKLPKCCKTLLKTPRTNNIIPMDNGHYLYFSLQNYLEKFLAENTIVGQIIYLDVGSDGVGVSKSSTVYGRYY